MKKVDVILGLQWGDEGKGKVVDVLTPHYQVVALSLIHISEPTRPY